MIASRMREHPELSDAAHEAILELNFAAPWWEGEPSPLVIYRDPTAFERAMHATGHGRESAQEERTRRRMEVVRGGESAEDARLRELRALARGEVIESSAVEVLDGEGVSS